MSEERAAEIGANCMGCFSCSLDAEIAESMHDPEYAAAWRRIELREATWGLDKRQARRVRRRSNRPASSEARDV